MKTIGRKKIRTPEENLRRLEELVREAELLRPPVKKKRMVMRFRTWDDLYKFCITRAARGL
ncbi:MAG: hypothetical protein EPN93_13400 [Spirochaetes bacterium]|nr:MAG: hypothetical protein EPN93_13400 [Spirochaetota bacterium]